MITSGQATSIEMHDGVALFTLERPERRNVLDEAMVSEIVSTFDEIEQRDDVRAVVVTGRGPAFCAGADLAFLEVSPSEALVEIYESFLRIARSPLPTLAAVNGPAVGAGMNLALCCDVRLAGQSARFASRFPLLGLHPGGGHGWMLMQAGGAELAAAMLLFGLEVDGADSPGAGLALRCVSDDALLADSLALAAGAARVPPPLTVRLKATLKAHRAVSDHETAIALELEAQIWSREQAFFRERVKRVREARARRP